MKRSEMINILSKLLNDERCLKSSNEWLGEKILNIIEEAGMLPPTIWIAEKDDYPASYDVNEWEDEE